MTIARNAEPCKLALEDGTVVTGVAIGATGTREGEVVFNTALVGYQEVFSDPSYCGQIVVMTFPHIGNYGINPDDFESGQTYLSGIAIKEPPPRPSNHRSTADLTAFLREREIVGIAGIDTRAITRRIRAHGALRGILSTEILDDMELVRRARAARPMSGANLVDVVTPDDAREWSERLWRPEESQFVRDAAACHVVALDCGIKHNILRYLAEQGCRVTVLPGDATRDQILAAKPDGLLAGNGPGDPAVVTDTISTLRSLLGKLPIFGICLGHQLLALALGAKTYKLPFGHHGINVPVLNVPANRVEITSQNHGFAVDAPSLEAVGGVVTHVNLNDQSVEGFVHNGAGVVCVQFHPEASPGPHDASYLFERFVRAVAERRPINADVLV